MRGLWWQELPIEEVVAEAEVMSQQEREATLSELRAEMATCSLRVQDKTLLAEERRKATRALAWMTSIRRHLGALVQRESTQSRLEQEGVKEAMLANVERAIDAGDVGAALRLLVDGLRTAWKLQ